MNALLQAELDAAAEASRVADLLGRAWFGYDGERADDVAEAYAERWAIQVETVEAAAAPGGLVSVPTTPTSAEAAAYQAREAAKRLRAVLKATEADKARSRIARMRRQVGFAARVHNVQGERPGFRPAYVAMLTLTYADAAQWRPEHLTRFVDRLRAHAKRRGWPLRYVWVAELQRRGAIHYHVALWLPEGVTIPKPDRQGWWPHGSSRIEAARGAVQYLMKYLSKGGEVGQLPRGARMHGAGGMEHEARRARRWLGLPAWIKARADIHDDWRRAPGGGWCDPRYDGMVVPGEHVRAWLGDRWGCVRVRDYGRPFAEAAGPFCWITRGRQA